MRPKHHDYGQTGLVMKFIRWLSPIDEATKERLDDKRWLEVSEEFTPHQSVAEGLCLVGLIGYIMTVAFALRPLQAWDIGIAFGLMVTLPLIYILVICLFKGFGEAYTRWSDFSTMKYAIPWSTQFWRVYVPVAIIGLISVAGRLFIPMPVD